jgi:VWFA-related protein
MRLTASLIFTVLLAVAAAAQNAEPELAVTSLPYQPHTVTLRARSNEVQVAATVRNRGGEAAAGLKQEDFRVFSDGAPEAIRSFRAIPEAGLTPSNKAGTSPSFSESARDGTQARSVILFFDDNSMVASDVMEIRSAARRFLASELPQGEEVAIATSSDSLALGFTSNHSALEAEVDKLLARPRVTREGAGANPVLGTYLSSMVVMDHAPQSPWLLDAEARLQRAGMCHDQNSCGPLAEAVAEETVEAARESSSDTLDALLRAIRLLGGRPGSRTLLLASSGFLTKDVQARQDQVADAALRANVVINSLEAQMLSAELSDPLDAGLGIDLQGPATLDAPLSALALATGGSFVKNTNDLLGGLRRLTGGEAHYILTFAPAAMPNDGKYHKLKVTVAGRGDAVTARPGYYDPPPEPAMLADLPPGKLDSLVLSSDDAMGIPVAVDAHWTERQGLPTLVTLTFQLDPGQLQFRKSHGRSREGLIVATAFFDQSGKFVIGQEGTVALALSDDTLAKMRATGVHSTLKVVLPKGTYRMREVVMEMNRGLVTQLTRQLVMP